MENPNAATTETNANAEPDGEAADAPGADSAPAAADAGEKDKGREGAALDSRIDELTGNWRDAQRERDHWRDRALSLERERGQGRQTEREAADGDAAAEEADLKTLADFNFDERAYGKYIRDEARKSARAETEKLRSELDQGRTQAEREIALDEFSDRAQSWAKEQKIEDADRMFAQPRDGGPNVTPHMAEAIIDSEHGPAILHYLLKNRAEAVKICRMSPIQQAREIGRLEGKVGTKAQPKTVSGAPAPAPRIDGGSASVGNPKPDSAESDKMSEDAWLKARNKQLAGKRLAASNRS